MRLRSLLELKKYKKPDAGDTLGIKRADMPQVKSSDYPALMKHLEDNGARFTTEKDVPAKDLKPVQSEFSDEGITKQRAKKGPRKPVIASSDNYIIDGHHRWLVALNYDETVDVIRVNMTVHELLKLVKEFPQTYYKDIYNEGYKLQLERDPEMYVLHIIDTDTGKRTEVRGKSGYESGNYDPSDKLHQLLDKIGKAANISELINGEPVGINPNHPDGKRAKQDTTQAFNESFSNPYDYEWVRKMPASWAAQADTENGALQVQFQMPKPRRWIINFVLNGSYEKTGTGDQFRILATTIAAIRDWFGQQDLKKINSVEFRANKDKDGSSRTKLYARFAKQMANELGWELDVKTKKKEDTFVIQKPKKVKEEFNEEKDYMHGYCHEWALMDVKKNPERVLYARTGFHYDDEYEEVDHVFTVDPKTGKAYDVRGEFANADALLADYDFGADEIDVMQIDADDIRDWISAGELKPISIDEDTPLAWIKRKYGKAAHAPQYAKAAELLHKILQRKHDETDGKLRHSLGYYAHMLSRQHGKIDWRELEAEYLERYGNELFESALNDMILKIASALADDMTTAQQQSARAYDANKKRERVLAKLLKKRSKRTIQAIYKKLFGKEPV